MKKILGVIVLVAIPILVTCSKNESPTAPAQTMDGVIESGGDFEEFVEGDAVMDSSVTAQTIDGEIFYCTTKTHSITQGYEDYALFDPAAGIIYPGALLQGASLIQATPDPIPVKRAPGTVVISCVSGRSDSDSVYVDVDEVTFSKVNDATNAIIGVVENNDLAARVTLNYHQISSEDELALAIGANFKNAYLDLKADFSYNTSHKYNRLLVKLCQSYYTIFFETPTSLAEVFAPSVTAAQLANYVGPGNPATFVSSVTYGRMFYLLLQSTSQASDLKLKVEAFVDAAVGQGGGSVQVESLSSLESLEITGFALGGLAGDACSALRGDLQGLKNYIDDGGLVTTGVPLSYEVRSVARPDKRVKSKLATEYTEVDCVPIGQSFEEPIFWYRADDPRNVIIADTYVDKLYNAFGDTTMHAYPLNAGHHGGELVPNALTGTGGGLKPAVKFRKVPDVCDGICRYREMNAFNDGDYTVFALAKLDNMSIAYPAYFMFGTSPEAQHNLSLGFFDSRRMVLSNRGCDVVGELPISYAVDKFNVYTFRFSRSDGMSIYINFEPTPVVSNPNRTAPLITYPQPRIGSNGGYPIEIVEIMAYGIAVSDAQRLAAVRTLSEKYIFP